MWSAVAGAGGAAGAILGGVLTAELSWRWVLFVNIPIGIITAAAAAAYLTEFRRPSGDGGRPRIDIGGAVTITAGLGVLVYAIIETSTHAWLSAFTLSGLAVAAVLLAAFAVIEHRQATAALVPFQLLRSRSVAGANVVMLLVGAAFFAMWYFLSLYLQGVLGYSALRAGLRSSRWRSPSWPAPRPVSPAAKDRPPAAAGRWDAARHRRFCLARRDSGARLLRCACAGTRPDCRARARLAVHAARHRGNDRRPAQPGRPRLRGAQHLRQVGGSVGLAALAAVAVARTHGSLATGHSPADALTAGYDRAFAVAAVLSLGGLACCLLIPTAMRAQRDEERHASPSPQHSAGQGPPL